MRAFSAVERELFDRAVRRYGTIRPCRGKSFTECFTVRDGSLQFWFNDATGNTHLLSHRMRVPA